MSERIDRLRSFRESGITTEQVESWNRGSFLARLIVPAAIDIGNVRYPRYPRRGRFYTDTVRFTWKDLCEMAGGNALSLVAQL